MAHRRIQASIFGESALNWPSEPHGRGPEELQAWLNHSNLSFRLHFLRDSIQLQATPSPETCTHKTEP